LGLDPVSDHRELAPRMGVMLQNGGVWGTARAKEMLLFVASLHANPLAVDALIERLGLGTCGATPYQRLSGGQQRRLGLAMALVGRPELVFLDEPTAGLDPQARRVTWELVTELAAEGVTVVLTTHYMEEAERLADHLYLVDHGTVVRSGTPAELTAHGAGDMICFHARPDLNFGQLAARLPHDCRVSMPSPGEYLVEGAITPDVLVAVTAWLAHHDVLPDGLTLGRQTLEAVFLQLTGHELRS
ncbi:MAG: ABC transporter ATP-binding protein, partial [Nocardioidaceae bacterium]|nr:ABC transporter ATP-binding protein [Nocardioidaceae bacterium]